MVPLRFSRLRDGGRVFLFFNHIYSKLKEECDKISWIHFKGDQLLFLEILYMIGLP